ncbi:hypothetical protein B5F76_09140 [Desulfovibrio sp. An276]|nr:hypothetical protein B5F76_09140 [Desulfovibrio sp. An276]
MALAFRSKVACSFAGQPFGLWLRWLHLPLTDIGAIDRIGFAAEKLLATARANKHVFGMFLFTALKLSF